MAMHSLFLARLKPADRQELIRRLYARQGRVCFICQEVLDLDLQADVLEVDHIIPIAGGGKDEENNFAVTHEPCNRKKSSSDLRVARVLTRFAKIEETSGSDRGANLGHVLAAYGGGSEELRLQMDGTSVRYSIPSASSVAIVSVPLWHDPLSGMDYFFAKLPLAYLHHDDRINPRGIGSNLRGLVEEFHLRRPQLQVALAWWGPEKGDQGRVSVFDGQHKAVAQILLDVKELPVRVFVRPDLKVLLEANTNAGDKLKQIAFDSAVKRHLGSALYRERVEDYQRLKRLSPDDFTFSEKDLVTLFKGEHREVVKHIVDAVRDRINRDPSNRLLDFTEWSGKGTDRPLSYSTIEKTFYSEFLYKKPLESPLDSGIEKGTNPRQLEHAQMVRLMSLFAHIFFEDSWDPDLGGRKLEDRVLRGESIKPRHLRAWRVAREEVLANILKYVRVAIEYYYALNQELIDKERLMHRPLPDVLWAMLGNVLQNLADLPCWIDTRLAQTIFGGKPSRDFWKKIFADGVSPTGIQVLARGLDLKSLVSGKGANS